MKHLRRPSFLSFILGAGIVALLLNGCSAADLGLGSQCTPKTCDYVVNQLIAVNGPAGVQLLADSNNTIYHFDGAKWQKNGADQVQQRGQLFASPSYATDSTLFLGNATSTNGGKTWQPLCAIVIAISPNFATDHIVFGKDANAIKSQIQPTATGTPSGTPTSSINCPATTGSFYISSSGGSVWNTVAGPAGAGDPDLFVVSPTFAQDHTIFATFTIQLQTALYVSTDSGQTWNKALDGRQAMVALSPNFAADQTVVAVSATTMQRSTDGGQTWTALQAPFNVSIAKAVAFSPNFAADHVVAMVSAAVDPGDTQKHGIFTSTDGGQTWTLASDAVSQRGQNYPPLLFSPQYAKDQTIYTSSLDQGKGPAMSTDGGQTWTTINPGLDLIPGLGG